MANEPEKRIEVIRMKELKGEMTQKEFENKTGISQSSYSKIINNTRGLSADNLVKIADAFDVSTDWLLGRTDNKSPLSIKSEEYQVTYGDIFKVMTYLLQNHGLYAIPESFLGIDGKQHVLNNTQSLHVDDKILGSICSVWKNTVTAPNDVYNNWRNSCIDKYSKIPYLSWDAAINNAYNHYFGSADVSPELLAKFIDNLLEIFKEIQSEQGSHNNQ